MTLRARSTERTARMWRVGSAHELHSAVAMSSGDGSNGRLRSRSASRDSAAIVLKLLQAATTWLRCQNLLVAKQTELAKSELKVLRAALNDLAVQPLDEENARELSVLHEEAARLESKLRIVDDRGAHEN